MADPDPRLDELVAALRDTPRSSPLQADATRRRVLDTLDQRARGRRRRVTLAAIGLMLGTGTMSWAATGGRLQPLLARIGIGEPAPVAAPAAPPPVEAVTADEVVRRPAQVTIAALERTVVPEAVPPVDVGLADARPRSEQTEERARPVVVDDAPARSAPRPIERAAPDPLVAEASGDDEARYRRAHELHFRGGDAAAALAAWDDYLAVYPSGRLAIEARWNRALALAKLGRRDDAIAALAPFAAGEVAPAGYRQREAIALTEALARRRAKQEETP